MRGWNGAIAALVVKYSLKGGKSSAMGLSFRDGPKDQTRNLEIPGSMLRIAPE
jgi:hypothetical protein